MRILLAHNSLYYPSFGGGDKSNRLLMDALAARGHEVRVVSRVTKFGPEEHGQLLADLKERGVHPEMAGDAVRFRLNGVEIHTLTLSPQVRAYFSGQVAEFDADVIVTSTDDPAQLLFEVASHAPRARLVYLVRATIAVPFGPDSSGPNREKTEMLRNADGIVGVSEYVAGYVRRWSGLDAIHVPISLLEPGEVPQIGRFDNAYVVMVNPCAVKGIAIFLALAERAPDVQFAAVPTWGTSAQDLEALRRQPNVTVIDPVDDMNRLFRQTRVALVPSLWAEARSRVVVEAMLRGVPVMASDVGGLKEAKLGVPYLIPVNPITEYQASLDENMVPVANVPAQDMGPWVAALEKLTSDREHWGQVANQSRAAALDYARTLTAEPFENFLLELLRRPKRQPPTGAGELSDDKRKLLALRLKKRAVQKSAVSKWFPTFDGTSRDPLRLFCFPHAGGGLLAYRNWIGAIRGVNAIPVLLPGRGARASEPAFEDMGQLVKAIADAIRPLLEAPYAFFGHSMGAGIAFELTRTLRSLGARLPAALIVSSARAPQLRVHRSNQPEVTDQQLIEELRGLNALPHALFENADALQLILSPLRADSRMYRNYVYQPGEPLAIPMAAYGGAADPSVAAEYLEGWREQTSASFVRREFEGGHLYLQTNPGAVFETLHLDLPGIV